MWWLWQLWLVVADIIVDWWWLIVVIGGGGGDELLGNTRLYYWIERGGHTKEWYKIYVHN